MEYREHTFNYDYNIDSNSKRIILGINISDKRLNINRNIPILLDTGASGVTMPAHLIDIKLSETEFVSRFNPIETYRNGIVSDAMIKYYLIEIERIVLGSFILHNVPVYITFAKNVNSKLLGMSLLRFFDITIRPEFRQVKLKETDTLIKYLKEHGSLTGSDSFVFDTYVDLKEQSLIDDQILESAYVNALVQRYRHKG